MTDHDALLSRIPDELHTRDVVGVLSGMDAYCSTTPILLDAIRDAGGTEDHVLAMVHALIYGVKTADTPRLVYADWLDDAGEADRAEFVRCQVELARTPMARIVDDQICRKCNRRCGDRPGSKYCEHGGDLDGKNNHAWENPLRRRERELLEAHGEEWAGPIAILSAREWDAHGTHRDRMEKEWRWEWQRGFIASVTLDWASWLRHHARLFWSPKQTVECPECRDVEHNYPMELHSRMYGSCKTCSGTGRIPRPFVPTAQPLSEVRLTTWPSDGYSNSGALWFVASSGHRFDRVKCECECDVPFSCPRCNDRPLNRWTCPEWPGLEFVMPPSSFPEVPVRRLAFLSLMLAAVVVRQFGAVAAAGAGVVGDERPAGGHDAEADADSAMTQNASTRRSSGATITRWRCLNCPNVSIFPNF